MSHQKEQQKKNKDQVNQKELKKAKALKKNLSKYVKK